MSNSSDIFKTMVSVIGGLFVFMFVIIILANLIAPDKDVTNSPAAQKKIKEAIAPVGQVNTEAGAVTASAPAASGPVDGAGTYQAACNACHGSGAGGAPKLGDKAAWADRIAQGNATLHEHAIKGYKGKTGYMPPKGGRADISDADVKAAVDYIVSNSK